MLIGEEHITLAVDQPFDGHHRRGVAAAVTGHVDDDVLDLGVLLRTLKTREHGAHGIILGAFRVRKDQRALALTGIKRLPAFIVDSKGVEVDHSGIALLYIIIALVDFVACLGAQTGIVVFCDVREAEFLTVLLLSKSLYSLQEERNISVQRGRSDRGMTSVEQQAVDQMVQTCEEGLEVGRLQIGFDLGILRCQHLVEHRG